MSRIPLSVIIPSYNRPKQTACAVESVVRQDTACEVIVIDDASDDPRPLTKALAGIEGVRLIQRTKNGGAGAARNTGLEHACGQLVSFLDSDDIMLPGTLPGRIEFALKLGLGTSSEPKLVACGWREVGSTSRERLPRRSNGRMDLFSSCWFAPGSCVIAPTTLFSGSSCRYDLELRRLEDFELFARLAIGGLEVESDPVLGVEIKVGQTPLEDEVSAAVYRIRDLTGKWRLDGLISAREASASNAYLAYEMAVIRHKHGSHLLAGAHLLESLWHKPRLSLFPGPGWTRPQNSAE